VHDSVRTATVTSSNYCTLGKIHLSVLYVICANFPFFRNAMLTHIHLYDDQVKIFLVTVLRDIPYLNDVNHDLLNALALSF
jgi:hypothetical protein